MSGGVKSDGIPALDDPAMVAAGDGELPGASGEEVFGIYLNGEARAYPRRFLDWHELLNDRVGGEPIVAQLLHPVRRRRRLRQRRPGRPRRTASAPRACSTAATS